MHKLLKTADVNHCLSFEQVGDEVIEQYQIPKGNFDTITNCRYPIPGFQDIGDLYSILIEDCAAPGEELSEMMKIFDSFIQLCSQHHCRRWNLRSSQEIPHSYAIFISSSGVVTPSFTSLTPFSFRVRICWCSLA